MGTAKQTIESFLALDLTCARRKLRARWPVRTCADRKNPTRGADNGAVLFVSELPAVSASQSGTSQPAAARIATRSLFVQGLSRNILDRS